MAKEENEETVHLRPTCAACAHHCHEIHGNRDPEYRSWPFFRKKMSKLALHQTPQAGICIPGAFMDDSPEDETESRPLRQVTKMITWRPRKNKLSVDATPLSLQACDHNTLMMKEADNNVTIAQADDYHGPAHASKEVNPLLQLSKVYARRPREVKRTLNCVGPSETNPSVPAWPKQGGQTLYLVNSCWWSGQ